MIKSKLSVVNELKWYLPLVVFISYFLIDSYNFLLHDFANYYFASKAGLAYEDSSFIYSIYSFNSYAWSLGYPEVLIDFYINSPFTISVFSPFALIDNALTAKLLFNVLSSFLFILSLYKLLKSKLNKIESTQFLVFLPILFFVPFRNQIFFGQSYFLVFACIVFALLLFEKQNNIKSGFILVFATLLKIFPVIYGVQLLLNKRFKAVLISVFCVLVLIVVSIWQSGFVIWQAYFTEVLPTTSTNHSGVGYQFNAQSMLVFLKTLFVKDAYYNPSVIIDSFSTFTILTWIYKTIVLAVFIQAIWEHRKDVFKVFVITTISLFLLQDRTATYTQILWIIPLVYIFRTEISSKLKYNSVFMVLLICNIPMNWLADLPILFKFGRMWLIIALGIFILLHFIKKVKFKYILYTCCFSVPICILSIVNYTPSKAEYVLPNKDYFIVHDYYEDNGYLTYKALGRNGEVVKKTELIINAMNDRDLQVLDNQVYYQNKQVTFDNSLKSKPKLVNNSEIYFLSDYNTRRGQFTLRKITVE